MKETYLNGHRLRCYHKPSRDISDHPDAWTVIFPDRFSGLGGMYAGIQYVKRIGPVAILGHPGVHLGRRIPFDLLPEPCRRAVLADCPRNGQHEVAYACPTSPVASQLGFPGGCWAVFFEPVPGELRNPPVAVSGHTTKRGADSACARLNA